MKNIHRKQINACKKQQMTVNLSKDYQNCLQGYADSHTEHRQVSSFEKTSNHTKQEGKGIYNFAKKKTVDDSIKELSSAVQLLTTQLMNMMNERSNQKMLNAVNILSNKIDKMNMNENRIQERFQQINIEPIELPKFDFKHMEESQQTNVQKLRILKERKRVINNWLGVVCKKVFSIGFLLYKKDQLKLRQVKAYCSENILRNIINMSKRNELIVLDFECMDNCLKSSILEYFKSKYPQTLQCQINMAFANKIILVDNMDSNDYDMVIKSGVQFQINSDGNYNSQIMELINYVVQIPQREIEKGKRLGIDDVETIYGSYEQKMNGYMKLICTRPQDRQQDYKNRKSLYQQYEQIKNIQGIDMIDKVRMIQKETVQKVQKNHKVVKNKEDKQKIKEYEDKVLSYSSFEIGQKLSKNFELYSQAEIQQQGLRFRNSAQIRVLTKWCEQLEKYFDEDYIMQRQIPFRMKDGSEGTIDKLRLRVLCVLLRNEKLQISKRLNEIKQNNYYFQQKFSKMNVHESFEVFLEQQGMVGQFSIGVYKCYQNYLRNYLNVLIHRLNIASRNYWCLLIYNSWKCFGDKDYFKKILEKSKDNDMLKQEIDQVVNYLSRIDKKRIEAREKFYETQTPQLISFNLGDLIRCRYTSKQEQILIIYHKLQSDPDVKIVRVKNRLNGGNRDILINALFKNEVMTEIQLCIKSEKSRFSQCSNQFNHFFYELRRAQFGPISEMVNLWVNYDKRSQHFMVRLNDIYGIKRKLIKDYEILKENDIKCCNDQKERILNLPFQCTNCKSHYFSIQQGDGNTICQNCGKYVCINCKLKMQDIVKELPIDNIDDVKYMIVLKEKTVFVDKNSNRKNLVLVNFQSKKKRVCPFRMIQQSNKIHFFEKSDGFNINLIKTFRKNENYDKQIIKFLDKNIVLQVFGVNQFVPKFDLDEVIEKYFVPKFFNDAFIKRKDNILIRGKNLQDKNIPIDYNKKSWNIKRIDLTQNKIIDMKKIINIFYNIQYCNLFNNCIQEFNAQFYNVKKLKILNLGRNRIRMIPNGVKGSQLEELYLQENLIEQIPNDFLSFEKLRILNIKSNRIKKIPQNISKLNNFEKILLNKNEIQVIPNVLFNLQKLKILNLSWNKIKVLPKNKPKMKCLEQLLLYNNQIEEIPNEFFNFDKVEILNLSDNRIKNLPQCKPNMKCLMVLDLSRNSIEEIPKQFLNFEKLKVLNLIKNKIKILPESLQSLINLQQLNLSMNEIEQISKQIFKFEKLKGLNMSWNKIKMLPREILNLKNLERLSLIKNFIEYIPRQVFCIEKLRVLYLGQNKISILPQDRFKSNNLVLLNLCSNEIVQIPKGFFYFEKLKVLNLGKNRIQNLSQNISKLKNLEELYLNNNEIINVPNEIINFEKLKILNLSQNKIQKLPQNKPNMPNIEQLILNKNRIQDIPNKLLNLCKLKVLQLSENKISKILGDSLNLASLEILNMSNNEVSSLPKGFFRNVNKLLVLRLNNNKIKKWQKSDDELLRLQQLYLSDNDIQVIDKDIKFMNLLKIDLMNNDIRMIGETIISDKLSEFNVDDDLQIDEESKMNLLKIRENVNRNLLQENSLFSYIL